MIEHKSMLARWARAASAWAWPVLSLASVIWSMCLLQAKLEAEVSTDPVVKAALDDGAFWSDMQVVAPLGDLMPLLALPAWVVQGVGAGLLLLCLFYVLGSLLNFKPRRVGAWLLAYPKMDVVGRQLVAAPLELAAAAAIIYFALPQAGNPGFFIVLGAFLISFSAGLISQVPGGIGVMEAVFLAVMPGMPGTSVLAALLVWRLLYLLIPLALSGPIILAFEHAQLRGVKGAGGGRC